MSEQVKRKLRKFRNAKHSNLQVGRTDGCLLADMLYRQGIICDERPTDDRRTNILSFCDQVDGLCHLLCHAVMQA